MSPASQRGGLCPGEGRESQRPREGRTGGRDRREIHPDSSARETGSPAGREEARGLPRCCARHRREVQPQHLEHHPVALSLRGPAWAAEAAPAGARAAETPMARPDNLQRALRSRHQQTQEHIGRRRTVGRGPRVREDFWGMPRLADTTPVPGPAQVS